MKLTIQEVAQAVGSENKVSGTITGVEFDSRKIKVGDLFVPLAGARDGHEFIQQAIEQGAAAAFWSLDPDKAPKDIPVMIVKDTLEAMQLLAKYYLNKVGAEVIAVTGSNGKTTTKDLTASVLSQKFHTYKTQGNYNNNIGLPYTILHMPAKTEKIVLEMGMDHENEITALSLLARPKIAAITMIGEAHIENLGSREGIAKAKMEIVAGLSSDGLLVIPEAEPLLKPLATNLTQCVQTFGIGSGDVNASVETKEKAETNFKVANEHFRIPLPGSYNVTNALIAYTVGCFFGLSSEEIRLGLANVAVTQNRTEWLTAGNGASILSDVYNANPTAMGLVLDTFGQIPSEGRRIAVLADMLELGPDSLQMHTNMSKHINPDEYAVVFLYGLQMHVLKEVLEKQYPTLSVIYIEKEKEELIKAIKEELQPEDSILLKGSNSMKLNEVVQQLQEMK